MGLHGACHYLYTDSSAITLSAKGDKEIPMFNVAIFRNAAKWLHTKQKFTTDMLDAPEARALIAETNRILNHAYDRGVADSVIPPEMAYKLKNSMFVFSGFKTMHSLKEASLLLSDPMGNIKPFSTFYKEVAVINDTYNVRYLRAEYEFAVSSSQMAASWAAYDRDGDRYNLQYRTAADERVRDSHAAINGVTLPKDDPFWDNYFTPNGWGCRCNVVQVLKDKYTESNSVEARKAGHEATRQIGAGGVDKGAIFRFNPGKHGSVMPPKHPYHCRKMGSCDKTDLAADFKGNEMCAGCKILSDITQTRAEFKTKLKEQRKEIK